jgi:maleate cis-trans isomerase
MAEFVRSQELQKILESGYGWRARIGFISPGVVDESLSRQFYRMAPPGVTLVRTSLGVVAATQTIDGSPLAPPNVFAAANELARERPDCIIVGGSPTVVLHGLGADADLIARIHEETGIATSTAQSAAVEALRILGIRRPVVIDPFTDSVNSKLRQFLEESGFAVQRVDSLGVSYRGELTKMPLQVVYDIARSAFESATDPDGIYFAGAPSPVVDLIELLECELETTVVSSGQATLWKGMQLAGAAGVPIVGYGRLLRVNAE